jgi:hypothetical protein
VEIDGDRVNPPASGEFRKYDAAHRLLDIRQFDADMMTHGTSHRRQHAPDDRGPRHARPAKNETIEGRRIYRPLRGRDDLR